MSEIVLCVCVTRLVPGPFHERGNTSLPGAGAGARPGPGRGWRTRARARRSLGPAWDDDRLRPGPRLVLGGESVRVPRTTELTTPPSPAHASAPEEPSRWVRWAERKVGSGRVAPGGLCWRRGYRKKAGGWAPRQRAGGEGSPAGEWWHPRSSQLASCGSPRSTEAREVNLVGT